MHEGADYPELAMHRLLAVEHGLYNYPLLQRVRAQLGAAHHLGKQRTRKRRHRLVRHPLCQTLAGVELATPCTACDLGLAPVSCSMAVHLVLQPYWPVSYDLFRAPLLKIHM